jgi:hypothetical protein
MNRFLVTLWGFVVILLLAVIVYLLYDADYRLAHAFPAANPFP